MPESITHKHTHTELSVAVSMAAAAISRCVAVAVLAVVFAASFAANFSPDLSQLVSVEEEAAMAAAAKQEALVGGESQEGSQKQRSQEQEQEQEQERSQEREQKEEGVWCVGDELRRVMGSCAVAVLTGRTPDFDSGCCVALRALSLPCVCAQLSSSSYANALPSSTTAAIAASCAIRVPSDIPCAGKKNQKEALSKPCEGFRI